LNTLPVGLVVCMEMSACSIGWRASKATKWESPLRFAVQQQEQPARYPRSTNSCAHQRWRRATVREIATFFRIRPNAVKEVTLLQLNLCCRWLHRWLTGEHKSSTYQSGFMLLRAIASYWTPWPVLKANSTISIPNQSDKAWNGITSYRQKNKNALGQ